MIRFALRRSVGLQKNGITKRRVEYWVIPPQQDAEFVANMEAVLETYAQPCDPKQPVACMDGQPIQLMIVTRVPITATKGHGERVVFDYERNGVASIFMFAEPLSGFRQATARVDGSINVFKSVRPVRHKSGGSESSLDPEIDQVSVNNKSFHGA